jgi:hypothetical protein
MSSEFDFTFKDSVQTFMARLVCFQWPSLAPDEVPPTCFHDFADLRITLELATFTTSLQRSRRADLHSVPGVFEFDDKQRYLHCPGLHAGLMSVFKDFGEVNHYEAPGVAGLPEHVQYLCDNREDTMTPPETILLALVVEEQTPFMDRAFQPRIVGTTHRLSGLGLCLADVDGTWKRHGFWSAYITWPCDEVKLDADSQRTSLWYERRDRRWLVAREPDLRSVFLRMAGAKMETLTLV